MGRPCLEVDMPSLVCRHPLDQQNTRLLQLLPGLQVFARNLMGASHAVLWH